MFVSFDLRGLAMNLNVCVYGEWEKEHNFNHFSFLISNILC